MMCLPDLLYLSSTVLMGIPLLCPLCPGSQRSSDTLLYAASNDSQTNAKETERLASTVMEIVRYRQCVKFRHLSSTSTKIHSYFSVCVSQVELRPFLSDPELMGAGDGSSHISVVASGRDGYQTLPSRGTKMTKPVDRIYLAVQ